MSLYNKLFPYSLMQEQKPDESALFWWMEQTENEKLYKAVNSLSIKNKLLIHFIIYEGRTQDEASRILGLAQSTVRYRIEKIKELLKKAVLL